MIISYLVGLLLIKYQLSAKENQFFKHPSTGNKYYYSINIITIPKKLNKPQIKDWIEGDLYEIINFDDLRTHLI